MTKEKEPPVNVDTLMYAIDAIEDDDEKAQEALHDLSAARGRLEDFESSKEYAAAEKKKEELSEAVEAAKKKYVRETKASKQRVACEVNKVRVRIRTRGVTEDVVKAVEAVCKKFEANTPSRATGYQDEEVED